MALMSIHRFLRPHLFKPFLFSKMSSSPVSLIPETPAQSLESQLTDSQLIDTLIALSKKSPKLVKSTESAVPGCEDVHVRSWKMNEFKYYDIPSPFPTLARGLFTTDIDPTTTADGAVKHKIVIRGYDKFFNINEVPWTSWDALRAHTCAPYTLSLKSNGCIIFIAAITPSKLIVTSKHSVGSGDETVSHAMMGRKWLRKYLDAKGRTEEDLAGVLWKNRWTAISELCDDSFEEHVLPYPPSKTGLHLHGLNVSSKPFCTLPHSAVDAFAEEWGFIRTESVVLQSIEEVKEFTDKVGKEGQWMGEAVEGFVVRTHVTSVPTEGRRGSANTGESPYERGSDFFFKIKFDEPYMMYRDWREVTKMLLTMRDKHSVHGMKATNLPKSKMKRKETVEYVNWVIGDIKLNPVLYEEFGKGKGIIRARERFFKWKEDGGVLDDAHVHVGEKDGQGGEARKTVIVPVAIPGCGKTTTALALTKLFGWGHTQSDNVKGKKAAPVFLSNVLKELEKHDVVIADKNNHLEMHRRSLRQTLSDVHPRPQLIALNWSTSVASQPPARIHRICSDRIWARGAAHQTLRPDAPAVPGTVAASPSTAPTDSANTAANNAKKRGARSGHEEVLWMFLNTLEELKGSEVDEVVEMDVEADDAVIEEEVGKQPGASAGARESDKEGEGGAVESQVEATSGAIGQEKQLRRAIEGLCPLLGIEMPSDERIQEAVRYARDYEDDLAEKNAAAAAAASSTQEAKKQAKNKKGKKNQVEDGGDAKSMQVKALEEAAGETISRKKLKKIAGKGVRYYGISAELDLGRVVEGAISHLSERADSVSSSSEDNAKVRETKGRLERFWRHLQAENRVTQRPHVTLVHKNELGAVDGGVEATKRLWDLCVEVDSAQMASGGDEGEKASTREMVEGCIEAVVWDERVMAIVVGSVAVSTSNSSSSTTKGSHSENADDSDLVKPMNDLSLHENTPVNRVLDALGIERRARLHVTVGTRDDSVKAVEAGKLVLEWKEAGAPDGEFVVGDSDGAKGWAVKVGGGARGESEKVRGLIRGMFS